jgi:hypothetical protein
MLRAWLFLPVVLVACGEADVQAAEFNEVCGEAGPFRVLKLPPGDRIMGAPQALGDRVVMAIGSYGPVDGYAPLLDSALWSTGPCGEDSKRLDANLKEVVVAERWPDLLFGRTEAYELVILEDAGKAGHVVFTGVGQSFLWWTEHGLVSFEQRGEDTAAALLHLYPADPQVDTASAIVLVESTPSYNADGRVNPQRFAVLPEDLFALGTDGALVHADLRDGTVTVEQTGVYDFDVSPDARWLLWQVATDEETPTASAVYLRDLTSGDELPLGDASVRNTLQPFIGYEHGLFAVNESSYINASQRVYTLDTLEFVVLEERILRHVFADGRWGTTRLVGGDPALYDPADGITRSLGRGALVGWGDDWVDVLDVPEYILGGGSFSDEGPLNRVSLSGEAKRLTGRATRVGSRLTDGRRLTSLDLDEGRLGQLVLIDPDAGTAGRVDDRVVAYSGVLTAAFGDEALVYSVDDGDRTGVWLARVVGE